MSIVEYMRSRIPLEIREQKLFELIEEMERESFNLFDEVLNLNNESILKLVSLMNRCKLLTLAYNELAESFVYLNSIEDSSRFYASKRYELKMLMTITATLYAFMQDAMFGILSYVLLSTSAKNYFIKELKDIEANMERFDDIKLKRIGRTLDNSTRIIEGKYNRLLDSIKQTPGLKEKIIFENEFIISLLEGTKTLDDYNELSIDLKEGILNILKSDLNSDSNNINELFDLLQNEEKMKNDLKLTLC